MTTKTNEERLKCVEKLLYEVETNTLLYFNTANQRIYDCIVDAKSTIIDIIKELQDEVKVIKERGTQPTVIEYKGERFIYQSDSTARGGVSSGKRKT